MDIVGIDFETANPARDSACQVGVVRLQDGQVVDSFVSLIRPPGYFSPYNMDVHGITPRQVAKAPSMAQLWPRLSTFLVAGTRLVAHNAAFDRSVLVASLAHHGIAAPAVQIECTVKLARARFPDLCNHKLPTVCAALGIVMGPHHEALSDATAAAKVAWRLWASQVVAATTGPATTRPTAGARRR